jgi:hypothetical protein
MCEKNPKIKTRIFKKGLKRPPIPMLFDQNLVRESSSFYDALKRFEYVSSLFSKKQAPTQLRNHSPQVELVFAGRPTQKNLIAMLYDPSDLHNLTQDLRRLEPRIYLGKSSEYEFEARQELSEKIRRSCGKHIRTHSHLRAIPLRDSKRIYELVNEIAYVRANCGITHVENKTFQHLEAKYQLLEDRLKK